jgi:cytochrome c oxidase cbb3-type subunit I
MNGSTSTSSRAVQSREDVVRAIDASTATPLALMFFASLTWLVLSALFALVASVKLHSPLILANCSWMSYGHLRPAANDTFVYGFASQAGMAVALWMLCRLGAVRLWAPIAATIAALFWNVGVLIGTVGILKGDTTGFEWLEFPSYGSALFFAAYVVIAVIALVTFARRNERELYPSQWYILAALLWFPWLYTTARLLLVWHPVRGAMQFLIQNWFASGLMTLWLGGLGVALLYYFIPKLTTGGQLASRPLAVFGFWTGAVFGPWSANLYQGVPLPAWIVSVSIAATVLTLVPLIATAMNLWSTRSAAASDCTRIWFTISLGFFVLAGLLKIAIALCPISALTVAAEATQTIFLYGFISFALFGAIYHVAPRITGADLSCGTRGKATWWFTALGIIFFSGALFIGGMSQGHLLRDGPPYADNVKMMNALKPFIRISTLGLVFFLLGNLSIFWNVTKMLRDCCRRCCCPGERNVKLKTAEATR